MCLSPLHSTQTIGFALQNLASTYLISIFSPDRGTRTRARAFLLLYAIGLTAVTQRLEEVKPYIDRAQQLTGMALQLSRLPQMIANFQRKSTGQLAVSPWAFNLLGSVSSATTLPRVPRPHRPALPCPALPCLALHCLALPYPALPCPALPCSALPRISAASSDNTFSPHLSVSAFASSGADDGAATAACPAVASTLHDREAAWRRPCDASILFDVNYDERHNGGADHVLWQSTSSALVVASGIGRHGGTMRSMRRDEWCPSMS
jgi:hypothetical protein